MRKNETPAPTIQAETRFKVIDPIAVLKAGLRTVRHHQFSWLEEDLKASGDLDGTKDALHNRMKDTLSKSPDG